MNKKRIVSNGTTRNTQVLDEDGNPIQCISKIHIDDITWENTWVRAEVELSFDAEIRISPFYLQTLKKSLNQFGYDIVDLESKDLVCNQLEKITEIIEAINPYEFNGMHEYFDDFPDYGDGLEALIKESKEIMLRNKSKD